MLAGAALFAHMRGDHDRDRRSLERARAEERRLGAAASPWVEAAALNQWNGGPAAAISDVAALRRRAERASDEFWQLHAALGEAHILATLIREARPLHGRRRSTSPASGTSSSRPRRLRPAERRRPRVGLAGDRVASVRACRGAHAARGGSRRCARRSASRTRAPVARDELASHYTRLGRPHEALVLARRTLPRYLRSGAMARGTGPPSTHNARRLGDAGRPTWHGHRSRPPRRRVRPCPTKPAQLPRPQDSTPRTPRRCRASRRCSTESRVDPDRRTRLPRHPNDRRDLTPTPPSSGRARPIAGSIDGVRIAIGNGAEVAAALGLKVSTAEGNDPRFR